MRYPSLRLGTTRLTVVVMALAWQPARAVRKLGQPPRKAAEAGPTPRFTQEDERFMRLAVRAAEVGVRGGGYPFGATIVRRGEVVVVAANTIQRDKDVTAHAEMQAIREACRKLDTPDLSGCTIYATGEPCPMCFSACFWAKIPRIVFGASIAEIEKAGIRQLLITSQQMKATGKVSVDLAGGCLRDENLALLRLWSERQQPAPR